MAVRDPVFDYPTGDHSITRITWSGLLNGDTGAPVMVPMWPDRTVQSFGTFGTGGSVSMQGSNDATNYASVSDVASVAMAMTAAGFKVMNEVPLWIRPNVTAGDGTTNLTIVVVLRTPTAVIRGV